MRKEQIVVDIDGTITLEPKSKLQGLDFYNMSPREVSDIFMNCKPNKPLRNKLNKLSKKYSICLWTSRSDVFQDVTVKWLKKYKVKYHWMQMGKPFAKYYVDDKFMSPEDFLNEG